MLDIKRKIQQNIINIIELQTRTIRFDASIYLQSFFKEFEIANIDIEATLNGFEK